MTDERSGTAIARARISLRICTKSLEVLKTYEATTDGNGTYRISGIDIFGIPWVYAIGDGYLRTAAVGKEIFEGSDVLDIDFHLREAAALIQGWVVTEAMEPLPGAEVAVQYYGYDENDLRITARTGSITKGRIARGEGLYDTTGSEGEFSIPIPDDGLCDFAVHRKGYADGFFPMVPADTDDALFVLKQCGSIEGKVTGEDGLPVARCTVEAIGFALPGGLGPSEVKVPRFQAPSVNVRTDEQGVYTVSGLSEDFYYDVTCKDASTGIERIALRAAVEVRAGEITGEIDAGSELRKPRR